MTRDQILDMARKAGFVVGDRCIGVPMYSGLTIEKLCERLVRIAQHAAYERAAENLEQQHTWITAVSAANVIRAMKEQE